MRGIADFCDHLLRIVCFFQILAWSKVSKSSLEGLSEYATTIRVVLRHQNRAGRRSQTGMVVLLQVRADLHDLTRNCTSS